MARTFDVGIEVTYVTHVEIEAEDWEEALDLAEQKYYDGDYDEAIRDRMESEGADSHDISVQPF